jgi:DNA gyrase/topoisomerase IV subunit A
MRLYQLTGLERDKIEAEYLELIKLINYLRDLLASDRARSTRSSRKTCWRSASRVRHERRTEIVPDEGEINMEDLIADKGCVITISHGGYVKRVPVDTFREQKRGGKGVMGMDTKDEDYVEHVFTATTHDTCCSSPSQGRRVPEEGLRVPEAAAHLARQGHRQPAQRQRGGEDRRHDPRARIPRGPVPGVRHPAGHRSRRPTWPRTEHPRGGHHRHQDRGGRPPDRREADQRDNEIMLDHPRMA